MSKPDHPQPDQPEQQSQEQSVDNQATATDVEQSANEEANLLQRIGELEAALAAAKDETESRKDAALRAAAEAENVRRRAALDVQKARDFALEKFAGELLPVVDNLERALQTFNAEDESTKGLIEGIEMTLSGLSIPCRNLALKPWIRRGSLLTLSTMKLWVCRRAKSIRRIP